MAYGDVDHPFVLPETPVVHEIPKPKSTRAITVEKLVAVMDWPEENKVPVPYLELPALFKSRLDRLDVICSNCQKSVSILEIHCSCGYPTARSRR